VAVTTEVFVKYSEEGSDVTSVLETCTSHAFKVGDRWKWIVGPSVIRELRNDFADRQPHADIAADPGNHNEHE
jgi:hypothetical protein